MENASSGQQQTPPEAEVLKTRSADGATKIMSPGGSPPKTEKTKISRLRSFRPSHKATFIGLTVVVLILSINVVIFVVLLKRQAQQELDKKGQVTISTADLNRLGINRDASGSPNVELIVSPNAQFKGKLSVAGGTTISGEVSLNSKLSGTDASLAQLQAGNTQLSQLNVNGDSTLSNLNLRSNLVVAGTTNLQGPVTLSQLLTVANSINVVGNLSVGGTLTVKNFSAQSLTSTSSLTIGGHIVTSGATPFVSGGGALGSNGTVSISGNDAAGIVSINIGAGAVAGTLANVTFRTQYGGLPKVVITPVGVGANFYLPSVSTTGFSIAVTSGLAPGGYRLNYIVVQ